MGTGRGGPAGLAERLEVEEVAALFHGLQDGFDLMDAAKKSGDAHELFGVQRVVVAVVFAVSGAGELADGEVETGGAVLALVGSGDGIEGADFCGVVFLTAEILEGAVGQAVAAAAEFVAEVGGGSTEASEDKAGDELFTEVVSIEMEEAERADRFRIEKRSEERRVGKEC